MTDYDLSPHRGQPPNDVSFWQHGDSLLVTRAGEGYVTLDEVVAETRNPRVLVQKADRAVIRGMLVTVWFDEDFHTVGAQHPMAGTIERFPVDEMMDEPALALERVNPPQQEADDADD